MIEIIAIVFWLLGIVVTKKLIDEGMIEKDNIDTIVFWLTSFLWPLFALAIVYLMIYDLVLPIFYYIKNKIKKLVK